MGSDDAVAAAGEGVTYIIERRASYNNMAFFAAARMRSIHRASCLAGISRNIRQYNSRSINKQRALSCAGAANARPPVATALRMTT